MIGRSVDGYKVVEAIDKQTYRAEKAGETVAIQVTELQGSEGKAYLARFGALRHPHVLPVLDVIGGYMITRFPRGGSLRGLLGEPLACDHALLIAQQLSSALIYAHQQEIVHGKIRPRMIHFLDVEHQHAVLAEFGLPHKMSRRAAAYVSPEIAQDNPVDVSSDLYSIGIVLYEMLLGAVPFQAQTTFALLNQHVNEPLPELKGKLPESTCYILENLLQKEPKNRFQSAQALHEAIQLARLDQAGGDVPQTFIGPANTTFIKRPRQAPVVEKSAESEPESEKKRGFRFWKR